MKQLRSLFPTHQHFPAGILLTTIALFRVISILGEVIGAAMGMLIDESKNKIV